MQKTGISTPTKPKTINYFKYEMKDTNQLLKDLISYNIYNMSQTLSRSGESNKSIYFQDNNRQAQCSRKIQNTASCDNKKRAIYIKNNELIELERQKQKDFLNSDNQYQNDQNQIFKDLINDNYSNTKRRKKQNPVSDLILQKFFIDQEEIQGNDESEKLASQKYKTKDSDYNGAENYQDPKQLKKQRKGLANISLRVKNIVSLSKKLTYKEVSQKVLKSSKEEIAQLEESQRLREVKNIKRRVYDALNVLVAVGILGKQQRCVCATQWTNIPGKKHSSQWQKINNKIEKIHNLKKDCDDKTKALKYLMDKYNSIVALQNKHAQQQANIKQKTNGIKTRKKDTSLKNQQQNSKQIDMDRKLMFPIIVFCPIFDGDSSQKIMVELQEQTQQAQQDQTKNAKPRVRISGKNIAMLGDFDCAIQLNLEKYRDYQKQRKIAHDMQEYSNSFLKKRSTSFRLQANQYEQDNIEDYFNDQMFN